MLVWIVHRSHASELEEEEKLHDKHERKKLKTLTSALENITEESLYTDELATPTRPQERLNRARTSNKQAKLRRKPNIENSKMKGSTTYILINARNANCLDFLISAIKTTAKERR